MSTPTPVSVLSTLTQPRLLELARGLGVTIPSSGRKDAQIARLLESARLPLPALLGHLYRDELRAACREHALPEDSRSRNELAGHLLDAAGLPRSRDTIPPLFASTDPGDTPKAGAVVIVRRRTYLVDRVYNPKSPGEATRVSLICLDDDNQGRRTEVLWELELGARVLSEREHGLGHTDHLDKPRTFSAYYNALRWNMVTATDARLFQAPFRAGVQLMHHQLTPLKRALELPRANLFIADDVGLGKTIEAGLVMQELLLRNQIDTVLIVAPASVCPQWQREMSTRFGQGFELYNRAFVQRRRQDRGFGVNPWVTHARFVISYQTLRRPEYKEPLHQMLKEGRRRTLLILDEAHTAAPSSQAEYAVFSDTTRVVGELAPLFDHRLFLSATPHNGHSNSFSTLLSLLDRQRFTRGVKPSPRLLEQVMVRRLKSDLRAIDGADSFPTRQVLAIDITGEDAPELELARMLAEYTALSAPGRGRERLIFVNLQKRLLSSVRAFCRTLDKHAPGTASLAPPSFNPEDDEDDLDDELRDAAEATTDAARAAALPSPSTPAADLLARMRRLALQRRDLPCAKVTALVAWIRANLLAATKKTLTWLDRRVIIFTEYGDTKTYLVDQLTAALDLGDDPDERDARIMQFHGGMSDDQRALVQRAFNGPLDEYPVRILVATDAAREGLNLQGYCADLFHFDIPWNPARMEQRNGRIDRALQREPVVRCHYFTYRHRPEDRVLDTLVKKVAAIQKELGSLAAVVQADIDRALARGIDDDSLTTLAGLDPDAVTVELVTSELESQRDRSKIERDLKDNAKIIEVSRKAIDFSPALLRETLTVGLELAVDLQGAEALAESDTTPGTFSLPTLPESWQRTLDTLRPPRERDEDLWDWRRRAPLPVVFETPAQMTEDVGHLHLSHPVTQRILSRLLAQGFSERDLTRVTAIIADVQKPVALALARLSLFGPGAARLHDAIIDVAAIWDEHHRGRDLRPLSDADTTPLRAKLDAGLHAASKSPPPSIEKTLASGAAEDFAALWSAVEHEAEAEADRAKKMLATRARSEADAMRDLLDAQERSITKELDEARVQLPLSIVDPRARAAWLADTQAMKDRRDAIAAERITEPQRIEEIYEVALVRVTPIGLVYLWPGKPGKPERDARGAVVTVKRKRSAAASSRARDPMERFHDEWLGMVQPIDGLVVSRPALLEAQVARPDDKTLRDRFLAQLTTADPAAASIANLSAFFADILGLGPERWIAGDQLPDRFRLAVPDTGQLLAPTQALVRDAREPGAEPVALVWELPPGLPLDARETVTGGWDYPPSAKFDRLLRHANVAIGLLVNGTHVRLMCAPHGASTGAVTFPIGAMATTTGRPILDAFVMLLHATRWFGVASDKQLPALLAASREAQGRVTKALADQVLEALHLLLAGFEGAQTGGDSALAAAYRDPALGADHVYAGLLTCMLRLVFVLYAEDNDLLPVDDDLYAENLSALALYEDLAADAGAYPDAMARRFGAYGRLLSLFRAIYFGVSHGPLRMPPRHGELFSPHTYPFLEGNREMSAPGPGDADGRRRLDVPAIDDETVYRVLRRLLVLGDERLSYKALDVEQIGSVYENLMGFHVVELAAEAVCLKKSRAWISGAELADEVQGARAKWLQDEAGLPKADADRIAKATAGIKKPDAILDALIESGAAIAHSRIAAGRFVIQPGPERRRSGSHYTPRSLTAPIVEKTLAPLLAALPRRSAKKGGPPADGPSSEDLLSLKICDPAMGSGAFLVEAVRQLGDHVVAAWRREGQAGALLPSHGPAHDVEDAVAQARRMVAQRCIYGVDRNPQAVTLAKLSLWLVTLAKNKPFSFLDHALRCGDSLVGLDIDQITAFHWDAGKKGQQLDLIDREIRDVLTEAVAARERIVALAKDDSPEAQREKERLLGDAQDAVGRLRLIGDLVLGAFFSSTKDKEREAERVRRRDLVATWLASGRGEMGELAELADEFRRRIPAFHWMIEYPEVFWVERPDPLNAGKRGGQAWIDGFVGNPPFLGASSLSGTLGEPYRDWLFLLHPGAQGKSDLVAHFFRRGVYLIGSHGTLGFVATNTIAQGDTRESGLQAIVRAGGVIYDAIRTLSWPGEAAVTVSVVHVAVGSSSKALSDVRLDGARVAAVNSSLRPGGERSTASPLVANASGSYLGFKIYGQGFVLEPARRDALVRENRRNEERIFPYLGGEEVNSHPTQDFERYVINFGDMTLEEAGRFGELLAIVRDQVKPERDRLRDNADGRKYKQSWWKFGRTSPALQSVLATRDRCLVTGIVSKHLMFSFQPTARVFSHKIYVFPYEEPRYLAVLQSRIHAAWAWLLSSTMRDAGINYSASDCFETFPFPDSAAFGTLDADGERLNATRAHYMAVTWQGLTTTYNQLKDSDYAGDLSPASADRPASPDRTAPPWATPPEIVAGVPAIATDPDLLEPATRVAYIDHLRHLHEELDRAVLAAYGWSDIAVPPYCPPRPGDSRGQAALSLFEDTIIDRLFALNAERAAEEAAAAGRPAPTAALTPGAKPAKPKKPAKPRAKSPASPPTQTSLLDEDS